MECLQVKTKEDLQRALELSISKPQCLVIDDDILVVYGLELVVNGTPVKLDSLAELHDSIYENYYYYFHK